MTTPTTRPRRYDQCAGDCTTDCGHCKGQVTEVISALRARSARELNALRDLYATARGELDDAYATIKRQRAECSEMAGERDAAQNVTLATRQMANEANARLRTVLLAALVLADDGRTSLTEYVGLLVDERDKVAAHRDRIAAALTASESDRALMEATAAVLGDQVTALTAERDQMRAERNAAISTAERLAADGPCYDQAPMIIGLSNSAPPALRILRAGHAGAHRAERGMTWVPTEPDTALTDLQATVKRMRADYARIEEHREQLLSQMEEACADRDRARREAERFTAVQRLSQQLTRELEQIRADAAVLREDCDVLDDKAARWHKQAKKRLRQRDEARELLDLAEKHVWDLEQQLARMSPVVEAARCYSTAYLNETDRSVTAHFAQVLVGWVAAYQTATVVSAEPADNPQAEQVSPVTQTAETEPCVWRIGDDEPGFEVTAVRDNDGDVWTRSQPGIWKTTLTRSKLPMTATWIGLTHQWAPLTDATPPGGQS